MTAGMDGLRRRGELVTPPRQRNPQVPGVIEDIVMHALAGEVSARYQRAEDLLADLLRARSEVAPRRATVEAASSIPSPASAPARPRPVARPASSPARVRTREVTASRFCWNCRKPLPARAAKCPFCGESQ